MKIYYNLGLYFNDIAKEFSSATALVLPHSDLTYSQLNGYANRLAHFMQKKGVQRGDIIAIINTKHELSFALMIACLKIGAGYTNIDRDNPEIRTLQIFNTCSPKLIFTDHKPTANCLNACDKYKLAPIELTATATDQELQQFPTSLPSDMQHVHGNTIAYIMFTSGSTGVPKGVAITHQNLLHFIQWSRERFDIASDDIFANVSPLYFDNSVFDFFSAFFNGAAIAPLPKKLLQRPVDTIAFVDKYKCTRWFSVPSLLIFLSTMKALNKESFKYLKTISFGGEGYPKSELKKLFDLYSPRIKLINVYGPTEGTCICSSHDITSETFQDLNGLPSLGKINPNFDYAIVDEQGNVSNVGELYISGPNIALGYYNAPEKTEAAFKKLTINRSILQPAYNTGDLVEEKEGLLYFLGRKDNQIKHMGYRIELEEIEIALTTHPSIEQAAVIYKRLNAAYGKIIAFISTQQTLTAQDVQQYLQQKIPEYMIPNIINIKDSLPKSQNGKIDKGQLRLLL